MNSSDDTKLHVLEVLVERVGGDSQAVKGELREMLSQTRKSKKSSHHV